MLLELLLVLFLLLLSFLLCLLLSLHGQLTALRPLPLHPSVLEPHLYLCREKGDIRIFAKTLSH